MKKTWKEIIWAVGKGLFVSAKWFFVLAVVLIAAETFPKHAKEISPRLWGMIEGTTGVDNTGFAFSSIRGNGNCRIVNAQIAFKSPGSKIVFGMVSPAGGKSYPHLWATDANDNILDVVCPMSQLACQSRKPFAVISSETLNIEKQNASDLVERHQLEWGMKYLAGFKSVF